jgi:hypothetical protein
VLGVGLKMDSTLQIIKEQLKKKLKIENGEINAVNQKIK